MDDPFGDEAAFLEAKRRAKVSVPPKSLVKEVRIEPMIDEDSLSNRIRQTTHGLVNRKVFVEPDIEMDKTKSFHKKPDPASRTKRIKQSSYLGTQGRDFFKWISHRLENKEGTKPCAFLSGPSGCGKSFLVECAASVHGLTPLIVGTSSIGSLVDVYYEVKRRASSRYPLIKNPIIVFDHIDVLTQIGRVIKHSRETAISRNKRKGKAITPKDLFKLCQNIKLSGTPIVFISQSLNDKHLRSLADVCLSVKLRSHNASVMSLMSEHWMKAHGRPLIPMTTQRSIIKDSHGDARILMKALQWEAASKKSSGFTSHSDVIGAHGSSIFDATYHLFNGSPSIQDVQSLLKTDDRLPDMVAHQMLLKLTSLEASTKVLSTYVESSCPFGYPGSDLCDLIRCWGVPRHRGRAVDRVSYTSVPGIRSKLREAQKENQSLADRFGCSDPEALWLTLSVFHSYPLSKDDEMEEAYEGLSWKSVRSYKIPEECD